MAIRRTDIEIILPGVTYQEKNDIPVWDGYPQKFSGQLKGNIENLLNETEVSIYKKYGITYSKLRVKRDGYYLLISTKPDKPFDIWEP